MLKGRCNQKLVNDELAEMASKQEVVALPWRIIDMSIEH